MSDISDIVVLSNQEENDPRNDARATVRVVLHKRDKRVLVDITRGTDATGAPAPVRIDPYATTDTDDVRGAYSFVERILSEWYARAIAAEQRAVDAEARALRAESRAKNRYVGPALPIAPASDPKAEARARAERLIALAVGSHSEHEAREAALAAAKIMHTNSLAPK